jgi:hypothetical protein
VRSPANARSGVTVIRARSPTIGSPVRSRSRSLCSGHIREVSYAIACNPFFSTMVSSRNAGPPGLLTPLSQSETRFFDTFR